MFFKNELKKRIKNEKGLTLIELLAVIVILAIIAAIAIPAIGNIIANQRDKSALAEISNAVSTAKIAFIDGTCGADKICETADLNFTGKKITVTKVDFSTDEKNPSITWAGYTFERSKFVVDATVDETTLNSVMQNGK